MMDSHQRYEKIEYLGEGQYAIVYKAKDLKTDIIVAVKKIKLGSREEAKDGINRTALREIKLLQELNHRNVVGLLDAFGSRSHFSLVFDFMDTDLENIIRDQSIILTTANIKSYILMTLQGLEYLHLHWILHRDLKPNNLLVNSHGVLKIADFGLAKFFGSPTRVNTHQVVTRWYRCPELLFGAKQYGTNIDIWSVGCILGELLLRSPLFPGDGDLDQLTKIFQVLGSPTEEMWPGLTSLASYIRFKTFNRIELKDIFTAAADDLLDVISGMLTLDPAKRPNSGQLLQLPFFSNKPNPTPGSKLPLTSNLKKPGDKRSLKRKLLEGAENGVFRITRLKPPPLLLPFNSITVPSCGYAARKGTREKARKKKVKVEIVKVGFIPHNQRQTLKNLAKSKDKIVDETNKPEPFGNVYKLDLFKQKIYDFRDAVKLIKESHEPAVADETNSLLNVDVELDMTGAKKTKFKDDFTKIVSIPHAFDHNEYRTIMLFSKENRDCEIAMENGATLVGGLDLIKNIQKGDVGLHEFKFVLAHPNILTEVAVLRGLLKKKFPNVKDGTLGVNIKSMVDKFSNGIVYSANRDEFVKSFGDIRTKVGRISMDLDQLEQNFQALLQDIQLAKPNRPGAFIRRVLLWSPPFKEKFKIHFEPFISEDVQDTVLSDVEVIEDSETTIVDENQLKTLNKDPDDDDDCVVDFEKNV